MAENALSTKDIEKTINAIPGWESYTLYKDHRRKEYANIDLYQSQHDYVD
jgi:hypothetical protein